LNKGQDWLYEKSHVPILSKRAADRRKGYKSSEFDDYAKKNSERIENNEDAATIVKGVLDYKTATSKVNITDKSSKQEVSDFVGRYKQLKSDPGAKQAFEATIRSNSGNINTAYAEGKKQADAMAASGSFAKGSDEYKSAVIAHQNAHIDRLVASEWAKMGKQFKNAQNHFKGEKI
jgi:uncharacterized protein YdaT